jgi:uncharacterized protein YndB with AHSA1/START domain
MSYQDTLATANLREFDLYDGVARASFNGKPMTSLSFERIIRLKPKNVFRYLTDATALQTWFATVIEGQMRQDGDVVFRWDDNRIIKVKILKFRKNRLISGSWTDQHGDLSALDISLKQQGAFTIVQLSHHLLYGNTQHEWTKRYLNQWIFHLDNLCSVVESGLDLRPKKANESGWEWLINQA